MAEAKKVSELLPGGGISECPHCGSSRAIKDHSSGEVICFVCGRVIKEESFDRGPEWRAFDQKQKEERSRAGPPKTETIHDRGLSTQIDYKDRDARGKSLSPEKRAQIHRMRKWHKRGKVQNAQDRNLAMAFGELDRLSSQLSLPRNVEEGASRIYRKVVEKDMVRGRSIEEMVAAVVYLECRREDIPRTLSEIAKVSSAETKEIGSNQRFIERELSVDSGTTDSTTLVNRFGSRLDVSGEARRKAIQLIRRSQQQGFTSGKSPSGIAAGALYVACHMVGEGRTQKEIAAAADVTEVTTRNRYKEMQKKLGLEVEQKEGKAPVYKGEPVEEKLEGKELEKGDIEVRDVEWENVVASVTFKDTELDLEKLSSALDPFDAEYNPDEFPGISYSPKGTDATFLIFASGKANCVGVTSVKEAKRAPKILAEDLAERGFEVDPNPEVEIQNLVIRADFGVAINLSKLHNSSYDTSYDPGSFPGLQLVLDKPDVDFLLFASGECVLHTDNEEDIEPAFEKAGRILHGYAGAPPVGEIREAVEWLEKNPRYINLLNFLQEGATTPTKLAKSLGVEGKTAKTYARNCSKKGLAKLQKQGRDYRVKITERGERALEVIA